MYFKSLKMVNFHKFRTTENVSRRGVVTNTIGVVWKN